MPIKTDPSMLSPSGGSIGKYLGSYIPGGGNPLTWKDFGRLTVGYAYDIGRISFYVEPKRVNHDLLVFSRGWSSVFNNRLYLSKKITEIAVGIDPNDPNDMKGFLIIARRKNPYGRIAVYEVNP